MNSYHSTAQIDEHTPLLDTVDDAHKFPEISPVLARLSVSGQEIPTDDLLPYPLADQATEMAFTLAVLLQLRHVRMQSFNSVNAYERWFQNNIDAESIEALEKQILRLWTQFLDQYRDIREIETVLWTKFPMELGSSKLIRVTNFLGSFPALTSHPVVMLSLSHTWQHGVPSRLPTALPQDPDRSLSWISRYDALCTPRVCHAIELTCHIAYLFLLTYYLLYPPNRRHGWDRKSLSGSFRFREILLMVTPLSLVHRTHPIRNAIPLLVPLSFLTALPSVPLPGSTSFSILLWVLVAHILRLHLPYHPSPLFLLSHQRTLPLANFLSGGLSRIIFPPVLFFLPALLVASFLVSISMADIFLQTFLLNIPSPSPMETRITFLYLFAAIIFLLYSSFFLLATTLFSSSQKNVDSWDRYSIEVGHMARMALINTITPYARLYVFPPPFNIIHLLFIRIPRSVILLLGVGAAWVAVAEKALWRVIVGPFVLVSTVLYRSPLQWISYGRARS